MKRIKYFFVLIILLLFLTSCEKKEYGLIELEFVNSFYSEDGKGNLSVTFAVISYQNDNTEQFLEDLDKVARRSKELIYYIDFDHIDFMSSMFLENFFSQDNCYHVFQNNVHLVSSVYSDYDTLYKELNGKRYYPRIVKLSQEYINEQMEIAKKNYEEGYLSSSIAALYNIWSSKEAKDFYNSHDDYKLIHYWGGYIPTDDSKKLHYFGFEVGFFYDTFVVYEAEGDISGFEVPTEGIFYDYYYKDGYFYLAETDSGNYKKAYKIQSVDDDRIHVYYDNYLLGLEKVY